MKILVTGGAGYIGSHTCVELLNNNYELVILDNFSNSKIESLYRVQQITGKSLKIYPYDLLNKSKVQQVFEENHIEAVVHLAGLKAVGESVSEPLKYYQTHNGKVCLSNGRSLSIFPHFIPRSIFLRNRLKM